MSPLRGFGAFCWIAPVGLRPRLANAGPPGLKATTPHGGVARLLTRVPTALLLINRECENPESLN
jgi:hypothetical protein